MGYYCPTCQDLGEKRPLTYREGTVGCLAHGCDALWAEDVPAQEPCINFTEAPIMIEVVKKRYAKR